MNAQNIKAPYPKPNYAKREKRENIDDGLLKLPPLHFKKTSSAETRSNNGKINIKNSRLLT